MLTDYYSSVANMPPNELYWVEVNNGWKKPTGTESATYYRWTMPRFTGLFFKPVFDYGGF